MQIAAIIVSCYGPKFLLGNLVTTRPKKIDKKHTSQRCVEGFETPRNGVRDHSIHTANCRRCSRQFYKWYRDNAVAARNAEKTQTVGLFATKLVKGLTGLTLRMEAMRIIVAHAQAQVFTVQAEHDNRRRRLFGIESIDVTSVDSAMQNLRSAAVQLYSSCLAVE